MTEIIIPIITGIVCLAVGVVIGFLYRKSVAEKAIGDAETEATRIINEAIKAGETKKRESVLEAKDEIHRQRVEADRELKERRNETQQLERRLIQREEALDKKSDTLDRSWHRDSPIRPSGIIWKAQRKTASPRRKLLRF